MPICIFENLTMKYCFWQCQGAEGWGGGLSKQCKLSSIVLIKIRQFVFKTLKSFFTSYFLCLRNDTELLKPCNINGWSKNKINNVVSTNFLTWKQGFFYLMYFVWLDKKNTVSKTTSLSSMSCTNIMLLKYLSTFLDYSLETGVDRISQ